jgi:hypothetical protein
LKDLASLVSSLANKAGEFRSSRLRTLFTDDTDGGLYPSKIVDVVEEFEQMIVWKKTQGGDEEIPEP